MAGGGIEGGRSSAEDEKETREAINAFFPGLVNDIIEMHKGDLSMQRQKIEKLFQIWDEFNKRSIATEALIKAWEEQQRGEDS